MKHENVLKHFSPDALDRFNECTSLRIVCEENLEGAKRSFGLTPFQIYSPMLALGNPHSKEGQILAAEKCMQGNPFLMDIKLDGERLSAQIGSTKEKEREIILITRNGNDYTAKYEGLAQDIKAAVKGYEVIVDGEVMAWDRVKQGAVAFGANRSVALAESAEATGVESDVNQPRLKYVAFDLLYISGADALQLINKQISAYNTSFIPSMYSDARKEDFLVPYATADGEIARLPLSVRREVLRLVLIPRQDRVEFIDSEVVSSQLHSGRVKQLEARYNKISMLGLEGLVIKVAIMWRPDIIYDYS